MIPHLQDDYSTLRMIDDELITPLEIIKNFKISSNSSSDRFRLQVAFFFKVINFPAKIS